MIAFERAWTPDTHFETIGCRGGDLARAIARLEGGCACRVLVGVDADEVARATVRAARACGRESTLVRTCELDEAGLVRVTPVRARCEEAAGEGALAVVQNGEVGPWLCRPLMMGAAAVVERLDAWLGVDAVAVCVRSTALAESLLAALPAACGGAHEPDPTTTALALRQLPFVSLRAQRRADSALTVAHYLAAHPGVASVSYPGLPQDPCHDVAHATLDHGFGPLLAFTCAGASDIAPAAREEAASAPDAPDAKGARVAGTGTEGRASCDGTRVRRLGVGDGAAYAVWVGLETPLDVVAGLEAMLASSPEAEGPAGCVAMI